MDSLYSILKFYRIIQLINNNPDVMSWKVFKDSLLLYARLCVTKNCPKFATCNEWQILMNC